MDGTSETSVRATMPYRKMPSARATEDRPQSGAFEPTAVPAVKSYEELEGAQGREVFFRPERHRAADLLPVRLDVVLAAGAEACDVVDVSAGGLACEWPVGRELPGGDGPVTIDLRAGSRLIYGGPARLSPLRRTLHNRGVVGAQLLGGGQIDIDDLLHLRDVRRLTEGHDPQRNAWQVRGREQFKAGVAEFRLWLEDLRDELNRMERDLPWHVVHGETPSAAREDLKQWVLQQVVPPFVQKCAQQDAWLRGAEPDDWEALKKLSQRHLHPLMMQAPVFHRCYHKPLGYPGDFEAMRYIYERWFDGPTLFSRAMNTAAVALPGTAAVRARKDMLLSEMLAAEAAWHDARGPLRIVSVAAGPAQEVYEFLGAVRGDGPRVEIVLFDQDKQALALAYARIQRRLERRGLGARIKITFLHDSIKRLLHDASLFAGFGPFNLVFCAGLFDYLKTRTAAVLTHNFWANLAPGGRAIIGNLVPSSPSRWIMEHHMDWYLVYRTTAEMLEMARSVVPAAHLCTVDDVTGVSPLLHVEKP
jgi:hypothetical protein